MVNQDGGTSEGRSNAWEWSPGNTPALPMSAGSVDAREARFFWRVAFIYKKLANLRHVKKQVNMSGMIIPAC